MIILSVLSYTDTKTFFVPKLCETALEVLLVKVSNTVVSSTMSTAIDPDTMWPPFATTTLPDVAVANVTVTTFTLVVVIEAGIITWSLLSYTDTITFFVPKLCVTTLEVTLEKVSVTVTSWVTLATTPVKADPSPSNEPLNEPENSDSCADEETILLGNCCDDEIIPLGNCCEEDIILLGNCCDDEIIPLGNCCEEDIKVFAVTVSLLDILLAKDELVAVIDPLISEANWLELDTMLPGMFVSSV